MGVLVFMVVFAWLAFPASATSPQLPDSGLVLAGPEAPGVSGFGLGDGGVRRSGGATIAVAGYGRCSTPGGVAVECRREGVKLTFPSGRELLCAPDGFLHLRDGSLTGPFAGGFELRLGDGSTVRFDLSGSRRAPIAEVVVEASGTAVRLWRRRTARRDPVRPTGWIGERLLCLGAGETLYRALALGPVVTLERVLAPKSDIDALPQQRLALQVQPLLQSMRSLMNERTRDQSDELLELRQFVARGPGILRQQGPDPARLGTDPLVFLLRGDYEIEFVSTRSSLRMRLRRPRRPPFVEWQLGYGTSACCVEASRRTGRAIAVAAMVPELAVREQRNELGQALAVFKALRQR